MTDSENTQPPDDTAPTSEPAGSPAGSAPSQDMDLPASIRRVEGASAERLITLAQAYEDLQTMLWCCERLVPMVAENGGGSADVSVDGLWTLALLCYGRAFSTEDGDPALTTADLAVDEKDENENFRRHQLLLHLRDHHAHRTTNPREVFTVGVAQDQSGEVNGVAVTSVRTPAVDDAAVRAAGALAYPLCAVLDDRIAEVQKTILDEVRALSASEIEALDIIPVATG